MALFQSLLARISPDPRAHTLFSVVQRMEYALKRADFMVGGDAMASWKKLGTKLRELGAPVFDAASRDAVANYLITNPPAKLERDGDDLVWREQHSPRDLTELMNTARDVRNSLFHGEKSPERWRDKKLIAAAQKVLELVIIYAEDYADQDAQIAKFVGALIENPDDLPRRAPVPRP